MSSISRYKKTGGFLQLLSLIETFGGQKREKFIEMIDAESPVWAKALREKMLSIERIFSWSDQVAIEVIKGLPVKNMAVVMEGLKEEQRARMLVFFSPSDKRRMEDALVDKPKPEEITANMVKLVELARKMLMQGELRAEKFDEGLLIPEEFEAKLEAMTGKAYADKVTAGATAVAAGSTQAPATGTLATKADHPGELSGHEVQHLQRTLALMVKENKTLKEELRNLRDKLDQIKRIA